VVQVQREAVTRSSHPIQPSQPHPQHEFRNKLSHLNLKCRFSATNPWPKSLPINTCKHKQKKGRKSHLTKQQAQRFKSKPTLSQQHDHNTEPTTISITQLNTITDPQAYHGNRNKLSRLLHLHTNPRLEDRNRPESSHEVSDTNLCEYTTTIAAPLLFKSIQR